MSEDFGTVSVKKGDRGREIEAIRQQYATHRDALVRMIADAPNEQLATDYQRLVVSIDNSLRKLDEMAGATAPGLGEARPMGTSPGNRPLVTPADHPITSYDGPADRPSNNGSRVLLMLVIGLVVIAGIAWLVWRASSDHKPAANVVEQPASTTSVDTASTSVPVPVAVASSIKIAPEVADYGTIRKGTRAVRQFEITNTTTTPISITVARSVCKCLYYEYDTKRKLPAKGKEALTVTVDGARAKAGALNESIAVTSKDDPNATGTIGVRAVIK